MKKLIIALALLLTFTVILAACGNGAETKIVGTWTYDHVDLGGAGGTTAQYNLITANRLTFKDDGTGYVGYDSTSTDFFWSYDKALKNYRIVNAKWGKEALDDTQLYDVITVNGKTITICEAHVFKKA